MEKYFFNFHESAAWRDVALRWSPTKMKMLQIRKHIHDLRYQEDWKGIEGVLRGVLYTDRDFCCSVIQWTGGLGHDGTTLLHDLLDYQKPPLHLLQMVIDIASPQILHIPDINGNLPLHKAICVRGLDDKNGQSINVIKFLVDADPTTPKKSLLLQDKDTSALEWCIERGDEDILKYLLTFSECREMLLRSMRSTNDKMTPLRVSSYCHVKDGKMLPFLQTILEATAAQISSDTHQHQCCLVASARTCIDHLHDPEAIWQKY